MCCDSRTPSLRGAVKPTIRGGCLEFAASSKPLVLWAGIFPIDASEPCRVPRNFMRIFWGENFESALEPKLRLRFLAIVSCDQI